MNERNPISENAQELFSIDADGRVRVRYQKEPGEEGSLIVCFLRGPKELKEGSCIRRASERAIETEEMLGVYERTRNNYLRYSDHEFPEEASDDFFRIIYKFPSTLKPMTHFAAEWPDENLWIMKQAVETLEKIHRHLEAEQANGNFLGKQAIFIDNEEKALIGFWGLADLFRIYRVGPWENRVRPDAGDDFHNLLTCFGGALKKMALPIANKYIENPDNHNKKNLKNLNKEIRSKEEFHQNKDKVYLEFKPTKNLQEKEEKIPKLIDDLNEACKDEDALWPGKRFLTGRNYRCVCKIKNPTYYLVESLLETKEFDSKDLTEKHYVRLEGSENPHEEDNNYVRTLEELTETADNIKRLPQKSLENVEKNRFKSGYIARWQDKDKQWFLLDKDPDRESIIKEINELREKEARKKEEKLDILFEYVANNEFKRGKPVTLSDLIKQASNSENKYHPHHKKPPKAGYLHDINEALMMELNCKESPKANKLQVGEENIKAGYYIVFKHTSNAGSESPEKFFLMVLGELKTGIDDLSEIILDEKSVSIQGKPEKLHAICTKPDRDKFNPNQHPTIEVGRLEENIDGDKITCGRQIAAADKFSKAGFVNNRLCKIIANPKELCCRSTDFQDKSIELFDEKLDEKQQKAIKLALFTKAPICLIHGPPGTGKTSVIVEITRQMIRKDKNSRILICSQTNTAVENVMERMKDIKDITAVHLVSPSRPSEGHPMVIDSQFRSLLKNVPVKTPKKGDLPKEIAKPWGVFCSETHSVRWMEPVKNWGIYYPTLIEGEEHRWINPKRAFLANANVIGATCIHTAAGMYNDIYRKFDCVIMDEASKATPAETLVPLQFASKVVLVGDHRQLPPYIDDEIKDDLVREKEESGDHDKHDESLFEKFVGLENSEKCTIMLNNQRRMTKQIGDLISKFFYDYALKTPDDRANEPNKIMEKGKPSLIFIDTSGRENREDKKAPDGTSRLNELNANVVIETLKSLDEYLGRQDKKDTKVAVISAYKGQTRYLSPKTKDLNRNFKCIQVLDPATVDSFQGRKERIVIYDIVRSGSKAKIGFLDNPKRLNVALSRAQWLLVIIGDKEFLMNAKPCYERKEDEKEHALLGEIVEYIDKQGLCFRSIEDALDEK